MSISTLEQFKYFKNQTLGYVVGDDGTTMMLKQRSSHDCKQKKKGPPN